jgi:hypothetical protein
MGAVSKGEGVRSVLRPSFETAAEPVIGPAQAGQTRWRPPQDEVE